MTTTNAPHGSRGRYVAGCDCLPCRAANADYNNTRSRLIAYGRPTTDLVDAEPARQHVKTLIADGMGVRTIAAAAGVARAQVRHLLNGRPERGNPPTQRLRPVTAAALLAVTSAPPVVDPSGTRRRLQALMVAGWSAPKLSERAGIAYSIVFELVMGDHANVLASTAEKARKVFDDLWDQPPPEDTHRDKIAASRTRNRAAARGWQPALAWDETTIDLPEDELAAELERQAEAMSPAERARCWTARYTHGDNTPLTTAAAQLHARLLKDRREAS